MNAFHLYLDSAEVGALQQVLPHPLVYGVTTNPTLLKRAGLARHDLAHLVDEIFASGVQAVHLQVVGHTVDEMVASGRELAQLGEPGRVFIKIPATRDGLSASGKLTAEGYSVTTTAVYCPEQVLFSALAGATYAAPYLGRLQDSGQDGLDVIKRMQALLNLYHPTPTRLLVASVRSREAVLQLLALGVGSMTLPPTLFAELLNCPATDHAAATFLQDAQSL